jgi:hypothetical protein
MKSKLLLRNNEQKPWDGEKINPVFICVSVKIFVQLFEFFDSCFGYPISL